MANLLRIYNLLKLAPVFILKQRNYFRQSNELWEDFHSISKQLYEVSIVKS